MSTLGITRIAAGPLRRSFHWRFPPMRLETDPLAAALDSLLAEFPLTGAALGFALVPGPPSGRPP
jgi:hypothetical protein